MLDTSKLSQILFRLIEVKGKFSDGDPDSICNKLGTCPIASIKCEGCLFSRHNRDELIKQISVLSLLE